MGQAVRLEKDFPVVGKKVNGKKLIYLDSAATSLTPEPVIAAITDYYRNFSANVHRGIHYLAEKATQELEDSRDKIAQFIGAKSGKEIIFVRNATEAINLVAYSWGRLNISSKDEIILTIMEHHSNLVPWQRLALENGATIKYLDIDDEGQLVRADDLPLTGKTKLVAVTHVSNALGTINPVKKIAAEARRAGALCLLDGAQAVPHLPVDVSDLGCDFYVFSGHKMLGPTGIGVLWAREELLEVLPPFLFGGEMIREVKLEQTSFASPPAKFEAGTPHIAGAIGLGAAVSYLQKMEMAKVRGHEKGLTAYALKVLGKLPGLTIYGPREVSLRGGVVSFTLNGIHAHDLATILDDDGVAVRSGHHCTMPLHHRLGISASTRASFYLYNTNSDVDRLAAGIEKARRILGGHLSR